MRANFEGFIQLLAKNLYPEPDVFVRELIQNAHDSIRIRQGGRADAGGADRAIPLNAATDGDGRRELRLSAPPGQLARVADPELISVLDRPIGQPGRTRRRRVHVQ